MSEAVVEHNNRLKQDLKTKKRKHEETENGKLINCNTVCTLAVNKKKICAYTVLDELFPALKQCL